MDGVYMQVLSECVSELLQTEILKTSEKCQSKELRSRPTQTYPSHHYACNWMQELFRFEEGLLGQVWLNLEDCSVDGSNILESSDSANESGSLLRVQSSFEGEKEPSELGREVPVKIAQE